MKVLDQHNINELSKILYQTNVIPSGNSRSFSKLIYYIYKPKTHIKTVDFLAFYYQLY